MSVEFLSYVEYQFTFNDVLEYSHSPYKYYGNEHLEYKRKIHTYFSLLSTLYINYALTILL